MLIFWVYSVEYIRMCKTTIEKIEQIKEQEKHFSSCVRHLKYISKAYLAGNMTQATLIIMVEIALAKMQFFSDKTIEKLLGEINGTDRKNIRAN